MAYQAQYLNIPIMFYYLFDQEESSHSEVSTIHLSQGSHFVVPKYPLTVFHRPIFLAFSLQDKLLTCETLPTDPPRGLIITSRYSTSLDDEILNQEIQDKKCISEYEISYHTQFHLSGQHHYQCGLQLPHHGPELIHSVRLGCCSISNNHKFIYIISLA